MAHVLRTTHNFRHAKSGKRLLGPMSKDELENAMIKIIQADQLQTYKKELDAFHSDEKPKDGTMWLDKTNNVIRLSGRVMSDNLTFDEQFPILLSSKGELANDCKTGAGFC